MAGHDVLAITLRAILYYLSRNPAILQKLRIEFSNLDGRYPRTTHIPYIELAKLRYLYVKCARLSVAISTKIKLGMLSYTKP
jgi:hypothetical protein